MGILKSGFKSILATGLDQLPPHAVKGQSVPNLLKNAKVTKEEVKWSDFKVDPNKKYTPEELTAIEANRKDEFTEIDTKKFQSISTHDERIPEQHNSYRRTVTTFSQGDKLNSRFQSTHYGEQKDYLMHRSMFERTNDAGDQVSVLQEIQSDLHFEGRKKGYGDSTPEEPENLLGALVTDFEPDRLADTTEDLIDELTDFTMENGLEPDAMANELLSFDLTHEQRAWLTGFNTRWDNTANGVMQTPLQIAYDAATRQLTILDGRLRDDVERWAPDFEYTPNELFETTSLIADDVSLPVDLRNSASAIEDQAHEAFAVLDTFSLPGAKPKKAVPISPFEKTWLKKGIEGSIIDALNKGSRFLEIPLRGPLVNQLMRGKSQSAYGEQVPNTAEKVAKSIGAKFSLESRFKNGLVSVEGIPFVSNIIKNALNGDKVDVKALLKISKEYGLPQEYIHAFEAGRLPKEQLRELLLSQRIANKTDYAVIEFTGKTEGDESLRDELVEIETRGEMADGFLSTEDAARANEIDDILASSPKQTFKPDHKTFNLYSSPVAGGFATYAAFKAGYSEEDIRAKYAESGQDQEEIDEVIALSSRIKEATDAGHSEEDIRTELMSQQLAHKKTEITPVPMNKEKSWWLKTVDVISEVGKHYERAEENMQLITDITQAAILTAAGINLEQATTVRTAQQKRKDAYKAIVGLDPEMTTREFAANIELVTPVMTSLITRMSATAGNSDAQATVTEFQGKADEMRIKLAKDMGIELVRTDTDPSRFDYLAGPGKWQARAKDGTLVDVGPGFWASIDSEKFELVGDIGGALTGGWLAGKKAPGNMLVKVLAVGAGMAVGATLGSQLDYMDASFELGTDLDAAVAFNRAHTAAEASILGELVGLGVMKMTKPMWNAASDFIAKLKNRDTLGAREAIRETFLKTDDELDEIVEQGLRLIELPENQSDKAVAAFAMTEPGGEELVKSISRISSTASRRVADSVNLRAKQVKQAAIDLAGKDPSILVKQDLDNYVASVKNQFSNVKRLAQDAPGSAQYDFDMDKLAIEPVLNVMKATIADPVVLERFARRADIIKGRVDSRTFTDLLDLRQMVNGFRFGSGMKKAVDHKGFKKLMTAIDAEIELGAQTVFENPKEWLDMFAEARGSYATMKGLEKNLLFKMLNKTGDQTILTKSFVKYMSANDSTWSDVMKMLPEAARVKAEGATIQALVTKHTVGENMQATHFGALSEQLDKISFTTPGARQLKVALGEVAKVFKNDVPLGKNSGFINSPSINQGLSDNLATKARYSLMSKLWSQSQQFFPGKDGRHAAMLTKAAKLLEQPLNVKALNDLMAEVGSASTLTEDVLKLQRAAALEASQNTNSPLVKLYGSGKLLSGKGEGNPIKVQLSRIATHDIIADIIGIEAIHKGDAKAIALALKRRGYTYMASGTDKVKAL